jgi:hypothetical protein
MRRSPTPRQWIARVGKPMPLEAMLTARWNRNFADGQRAVGHAIALGGAVLFAWLVGYGIAVHFGADFLVRAPAILFVACVVGGIAALLLGVLSNRGVRPRLFGQIAKAGWIAFLPLGIAFGALAILSRASAEPGPPLRAQIIGFDTHGRGFMRSTSSILALGDGSTIEIEGWAGERHRCLLVRHLPGRFGFAWLRVEDGSPPPRAGQLNWPIARRDCFSDRPLATLRD